MKIKNFGETRRRGAVEGAIGSVLNDGLRTADLAMEGHEVLGCQAMTQAVIARLE